MVHADSGPRLRCPRCDKTLKHEASLQHHLRVQHGVYQTGRSGATNIAGEADQGILHLPSPSTMLNLSIEEQEEDDYEEPIEVEPHVVLNRPMIHLINPLTIPRKSLFKFVTGLFFRVSD